MSTTISDSTYHNLSRFAYQDEKDLKESDIGDWKPIQPKGAILHDPVTGFDATVFQNEKTKEIVVSYRGTEGDKPLDRSGPDFYTDVRFIALGGKPIQDGEKINIDDKSQVVAANQFTQAVTLMEQVKKEYKDEGVKISATGHSLGGAQAQYVAAMSDVSAVTYFAPGVYDMLPKEIQKKVDAGEYKGQI